MRVNPSEPGRTSPRRAPLAVALSAGTELVVSVLGGFFAGYYADKKLGTHPWLMLVGAFLGISVGLYLLIRAASVRPNGRP
ncbi:MAG: AtpZ/AtpI family protein [Elusimicrobiota bacterium]